MTPPAMRIRIASFSLCIPCPPLEFVAFIVAAFAPHLDFPLVFTLKGGLPL